MQIAFSIIIPLFNKEISVKSTIESVINQTYTNFELLIVNDGSTDNSLEVVQIFNDPRIRIINKKNGGVSSARNTGILEAKKDFLVFLDADDLWHLDCLQEFCTLIMNFPEASVYATNYTMTGLIRTTSERKYYINDYYYMNAAYLAKWSISLMLTGCIASKKECFHKTGLFLEGVTNGEDVYMWQCLADNFKIAKSEKITTIYRMDTENKNCQMNDSDRIEPEQKKIIRKEVINKSQRLFYGVQFLFSIRGSIKKRKYNELFARAKYVDWIFKALIFVIKLRLFNQEIEVS